MNDLIRIQQQSIGTDLAQTVNARDLHTFLEVRRDFTTWIKQRIAKYGFVEGEDYGGFRQNWRKPPRQRCLLPRFGEQRRSRSRWTQRH